MMCVFQGFVLGFGRALIYLGSVLKWLVFLFCVSDFSCRHGYIWVHILCVFCGFSWGFVWIVLSKGPVLIVAFVLEDWVFFENGNMAR